MARSEASEYSKYYLGIPVDGDLKKEYDQLCTEVGNIDPNLYLLSPEIPHITLIYLGSIDPHSLQDVLSATAYFSKGLFGLKIGIGGYATDTRSGKDSILISLAVDNSQQLVNFRSNVCDSMSGEVRSRVRENPFNPHLSIGYANNAGDYKSSQAEAEIKTTLNGVEWLFEPEGVALYGKTRANGRCSMVKEVSYMDILPPKPIRRPTRPRIIAPKILTRAHI